MPNEPQKWDEFIRWIPTYPDSIISDGILYQQNKLILYGKYKSFKSMMALYLMLCVASGNDWMGFKTVPTKVMYLQLEMPHSLLHKRFKTMYDHWTEILGNKILEPFWVWSEPFLKLDSGDGIRRIRQYVEQHKPGLLIIDPLYKVLSGNILDPNQVRVLADGVDQLIDDYKISVMLCHHPRKPGLENSGEPDPWGSDDMLGSAVFSWWADSIMKLARNDKSTTIQKHNRLTLSTDIIRYAETELVPREVVFNRDTLQFDLVENLVVL